MTCRFLLRLGKYLMPLIAAGCVASCTLPPTVSMMDCEVMCSKQGRTVKTYRVGSAVPIFKRTPPVVCECS